MNFPLKGKSVKLLSFYCELLYLKDFVAIDERVKLNCKKKFFKLYDEPYSNNPFDIAKKNYVLFENNYKTGKHYRIVKLYRLKSSSHLALESIVKV